MSLVLGLPQGTLDEVHELLKAGGPVVRPRVLDVLGLADALAWPRVRYVDVNTTVPAALRNGTQALPFSTLAAAVASLPSGGVVLIAPGSYLEPNVVIGAAQPMCLIGLTSRTPNSFTNCTFTNSIISSADLSAQNLNLSNALLSTQRVVSENCQVTNWQAGSGDSRAISCVITNISCTGNLLLRSSVQTNNFSVGNLEAWDSQINTFTSTASATLRNCIVTAAATVGTNANVWKTRFGLSLAVTGNLVSDYDSVGSLGAALTFGSFTLNAGTPKITLVVAVPAVLAGDVGYVTTSLVGTPLAGISPAGTLFVAAPQADLVAAGPGGGFINAWSAGANLIRFSFLGPLAGGNANFTVGVV